jgi:uncharacterized membrane protein YccC
MDWGALRETAPFLAGLIVPPILMLARSTTWPGQVKFVVTLLVALVLGFLTSALVGELAAGPPDSLISVLIDSSLAFAGSQVAYRFAWRPLLERRVSRQTVTEAERRSTGER